MILLTNIASGITFSLLGQAKCQKGKGVNLTVGNLKSFP